MLPYLLLAGACVTFAFQSIFVKFYQERTDSSLHASMWEIMMVAVSMFAVIFAMNKFSVSTSSSDLIYAVVYTLCSVVCTVASLVAYKHTTVVIVSLYTMLGGIVLPFLYGVFFLNEKPSVFCWAGNLVMIASLFVPFLFQKKYGVTNEKSGEKSSPKAKIITLVCCILLFMSNGLISVVTTASKRAAGHVSDNDFLLVATAIKFLVAFLFLAIMRLTKKPKNLLPIHTQTGKPASGKIMLVLAAFCFGYAILNGAGNICSMRCAASMDASIQYSIISAACIILAAVVARVLFKEKPKLPDYISIAMSMLGLVLIVF